MQNQPTSTTPEWTIAKLLKWTTSYFDSHDIDSPRAAAEILLAHVLNLSRIDLYLRYDQPLNPSELTRFKALIKRRINREPVAYIVGVKEFWSMDLTVSRDVLIPRPETECLVEAALAVLAENKRQGSSFKTMRILELGTGSGAVVLALAAHCKEPLFFAADCSVKSVELAAENTKRHGFEEKIQLFCGDWLAPLNNRRSRLDMILSNPPYIQSQVIEQLQPEIFKYEPRVALDGGPDGLYCLRHIISNAHEHLVPKGYLLLEIGHDQKAEVTTIIDSCVYYEGVVFKKDYSGYDRVVQMRKKA
jgi:release factor glutamine methyltransferase